jgi:hypothetical protein
MRSSGLCLLFTALYFITGAVDIVFAAPLKKTNQLLSIEQLFYIEHQPICSWEEQIRETLQKLVESDPLNRSQSSDNSCSFSPTRHSDYDLSFEIRQSSEPNALALRQHGGLIVLTSSLLNTITSPSELAFVLAHELAHLQHEHIPAPPVNLILTNEQEKHIDSIRRKWEIQADQEATRMLISAGYNPTHGAQLLKRLNRRVVHYPPKPWGREVHPTFETRNRYLSTLPDTSNKTLPTTKTLSTSANKQLG